MSPNDTPELEIWKPVPGYEGLYEASTLGNVRGLKHKKNLKPSASRKRLGVNLCKGTTVRYRRVHLIIAETFLGKAPIGCEVNHKNLNPADNRIENLEYITPEENITHYVNTKIAGNGLTRSDLYAIIDKVVSEHGSVSVSEMCALTGISNSTMRPILRAKNRTDRINGRVPIEIDNPCVKIKSHMIPEILRLIKEGGISQTVIAKMYGVNEAQITRIKNGKRKV